MASPVARAGGYVKQPTGYRAFVPASLPPDPPLTVDQAMLGILSRADQALGRLDGLAQTLPNPDLFVLGATPPTPSQFSATAVVIDTESRRAVSCR